MARQRLVQGFLLHLALTAGVALFTLPLLWMVIAATLPDSELFAYPPRIVPGEWFGRNLEALQRTVGFSRVLLNSVSIAVIYTAASVFLCTMGGYAFAKYRFRGREVLFLGIVATLTIPTYVTLLPQFILITRLGLIDTYWAVVLPTVANALGIFLMRQNMHVVPDDLIESARIDGAGEFQIFWSVALPILRPALAALGIILFLFQWNDYLWPLIVLRSQEAFTVPVALGRLVGLTRVAYGGIMVGTVIATAPFLIVFLFLQRYFVAGITGGAVKQ